jgi:hypothetical protein
MFDVVDTGNVRWVQTNRLRLIFHWNGDRWEHRIEYFDGNLIRRPFALSVEGDPERDDPTRVISPAYQQIQFQAAGPKITQVLLVGQSGPHHFSAVFAMEETDFEQVSIKVDVADRCRGPVDALASTYNVAATSSNLVGADPTLAAWDFGSDRLTFSSVPPAQIVLAEAGRQGTQIQALASPAQDSPTRRFLYTWHWQPSLS